jgi:hypothetical protein
MTVHPYKDATVHHNKGTTAHHNTKMTAQYIIDQRILNLIRQVLHPVIV